MSFWGELKRRNVFKVGAAYAIVAWLLVQIANTFFPIFHMPSWTVTLVASLLVMGLPVAFIFAWAYEMTPEGVKLTKKVPLSDSITQVTGRKLNYVLAGVIVLAVAYILFDNFYLDRRVVETEVASTVPEQVTDIVDIEEAPKTIAVLPFADMSPEKDQEYFVDGLSEELLNCLAKINGLRVTSRTSSFSFKNTGNTLQEVASVLGVEHILEGSVRKAEDKLRITAQLIRVKDDSHLWSETYDRELKDIFNVQENIATTVANELKVKLGIGETLKQLGGTDNVEAYELYLVAKGQESSLETGPAMALIDQAIALDPTFALAWALKAKIHIALTIFGPAGSSAPEQDAAIQAAQKAIGLESNLADGYYQLSLSKFSKGDFIESELAYRRGTELENGTLGATTLIGLMYNAVGFFDNAYEINKILRQNDPLNQLTRGFYFLSIMFLGDVERAEEEYERGMELFGDDWYLGNSFITNIRLGYDDVTPDDIVSPIPIYDIIKEHLDSPENGLASLRQFYSNTDNLSSAEFFYISCCAAYFKDLEFAMDAIEKASEIDTVGLFHIWLPIMHEVRQTPRFKEFVREIGLVDYWEKFGWPDICQPTDDGDFVCD